MNTMIDINKSYKTRTGFRVEIYKIHPTEVHGVIYDNQGNVVTSSRWDIFGRSKKEGVESCNDLLLGTIYDNFTIDSRVYAWDDLADNVEPKTIKCYFAGVNNEGKPMSWELGCTSWSSLGLGYATTWDNMVLAND